MRGKSITIWEVCQAKPPWQLQFKEKLLFIYLKRAPSVNKKQLSWNDIE